MGKGFVFAGFAFECVCVCVSVEVGRWVLEAY